MKTLLLILLLFTIFTISFAKEYASRTFILYELALECNHSNFGMIGAMLEPNQKNDIIMEMGMFLEPGKSMNLSVHFEIPYDYDVTMERYNPMLQIIHNCTDDGSRLIWIIPMQPALKKRWMLFYWRVRKIDISGKGETDFSEEIARSSRLTEDEKTWLKTGYLKEVEQPMCSACWRYTNCAASHGNYGCARERIIKTGSEEDEDYHGYIM